MIIFGTRGVTYGAGKGMFHCPRCGAQSYKHKRVRRFFTLYFVPLVPLDLLGEYVECQGCYSTWDPEILGVQREDEAFAAEFELAIRRVMVLMMLADGVVDDDEVDTIKQIYAQLAESELTDAQVADEIAAAERDGVGLDAYLGALVARLNDSGKELVVRAAWMVAAADGQFSPEEQALLKQIGDVLEMSPTHVDGVLAEMAA